MKRSSARRTSPEPRRARRVAPLLIDRVAASVAALAAGARVGGIVALGAWRCPVRLPARPGPFSGDAMSAAFARFDQFALGAAVILLGAEVARTWAAYRHAGAGPRGARAPGRRHGAGRVRRVRRPGAHPPHRGAPPRGRPARRGGARHGARARPHRRAGAHEQVGGVPRREPGPLARLHASARAAPSRTTTRKRPPRCRPARGDDAGGAPPAPSPGRGRTSDDRGCSEGRDRRARRRASRPHTEGSDAA